MAQNWRCYGIRLEILWHKIGDHMVKIGNLMAQNWRSYGLKLEIFWIKIGDLIV